MSPSRRHHGPDGRFRNPWPGLPGLPGGGAMLRWVWDRMRNGIPPDPRPEEIPSASPDPAYPRLPAGSDEIRLTWIGHATFLVQFPGVNLLTDPMFSDRASPVAWTGPRRFLPPGLPLDQLPPVDAVLLSHDHYDHLDAPTVAALRDREADRLTWFTPLGYRSWFARRQVHRVVELDWWEEATFAPPSRGGPGSATAGPGSTTTASNSATTGPNSATTGPNSATSGPNSAPPVRLIALPARHWTRRFMEDTQRRLWCSWGVEWGGRRLYFGGDSGYGPAFTEAGARRGPFDLAILPIGAYEPRWFMASSHVTPEEAVQAAMDLGAGTVVGSHWGTFRLTDEYPLEPPDRMRRAWSAARLPPERLAILAVGETRSFQGHRRDV